MFGVADGLLNRDLENEVFKCLSVAGISPKLIGQTSWGRFEEFLIDYYPLPSGLSLIQTGPDLDMVSLIAKQLCILHKTELPLSREFANADVFQVMTRWVSLASRYGDKIKASSPESTPPTINQLEAEIKFVTETCLNTLRNHPRIKNSPFCMQLFSTVLCHNDMLSGNLLLKGKSLRLIDFEYSGYNYAVADIANLLCAVSESVLISGEPQDVKTNLAKDEIQLHLLQCYFGTSIPPTEQTPLLAVIGGFLMADELRWTIWNVIQENQSLIAFDYCRCYNSRFHAYLDYKDMQARRLSML